MRQPKLCSIGLGKLKRGLISFSEALGRENALCKKTTTLNSVFASDVMMVRTPCHHTRPQTHVFSRRGAYGLQLFSEHRRTSFVFFVSRFLITQTLLLLLTQQQHASYAPKGQLNANKTTVTMNDQMKGRPKLCGVFPFWSIFFRD